MQGGHRCRKTKIVQQSMNMGNRMAQQPSCFLYHDAARRMLAEAKHSEKRIAYRCPGTPGGNHNGQSRSSEFRQGGRTGEDSACALLPGAALNPGAGQHGQAEHCGHRKKAPDPGVQCSTPHPGTAGGESRAHRDAAGDKGPCQAVHKGDGQDRHPADRDERERQRHP